jgi:pyruvate,water dikinase
MLQETARIRRWHERDLPRYVRHFRGHMQRDLRSMSSAELLAFVNRLTAEACEFWFFLGAVGYGLEQLAFKRIYDHLVPGEKPHHSVLFSGYENRMLDAQAALYDLATRIREHAGLVATVLGLDPAARPATARLPRWVNRAIAAYNREHGHQVLSLDVYWPTLGESTEWVLRALQQMLGAEPVDPRRSLRSARERRQEAETALKQRFDVNTPLRRRFEIALEFFQSHAAVREDCNYYLQIGWPLIRRAILLIGKRMVATAAIEDPQEIHFLEYEELHRWIHGESGNVPLSRAARERRRTWGRQRRLQAPDTLGVDGEPAAGVDETSSLKGFGASAGVQRGPVRVVVTDADAKAFRRGEVLVLRAASPLFMPLMLTAGGLVAEVGGVTSHSSLIARELGLPAVVNVANATRLLTNGQHVEVNGATGEVRLLPSA